MRRGLVEKGIFSFPCGSGQPFQPMTILARHYRDKRWVEISVSGNTATAKDAEVEGEGNWWIAPGLVDLQVNGYAGVDFQAPDVSVTSLKRAVRALHRDGCTRFLLTLITDHWEKLLAKLQRLHGLVHGDPELEEAIAGWHIEGPFLSPEEGYKGAHNADAMIDPVTEDLEILKESLGDDDILITLAPERNDAEHFIAYASELGIRTSVGHSNPTAEQLRVAVESGLSGITHLGNACPRELDRHDNILWRLLDEPGLYTGVICDGIHVRPPAFRLFHRAIPQDRIYYTTDAMSAAGAAPGQYRLADMELEVGEGQVVRLPGTNYLAGSALRPWQGIVRAAAMLDRPWQQVWDHFSTVPCEFMGIQPGEEWMELGDFCLMRWDGNQQVEWKTYLRGNLVGEEVWGEGRAS